MTNLRLLGMSKKLWSAQALFQEFFTLFSMARFLTSNADYGLRIKISLKSQAGMWHGKVRFSSLPPRFLT